MEDSVGGGVSLVAASTGLINCMFSTEPDFFLLKKLLLAVGDPRNEMVKGLKEEALFRLELL